VILAPLGKRPDRGNPESLGIVVNLIRVGAFGDGNDRVDGVVHRIHEVTAVFHDENNADIPPGVTAVAVSQAQDGFLAGFLGHMAGVLRFAHDLGVHGPARQGPSLRAVHANAERE
jgi:hypothetical protein